ncbi:hypothetical protein [Hydrogenophaga electricum]|uniref:Signal transduction histidine kinase n=1 Tax=Hydrogenophaga electricum TaxID=1230953 RepID=A0ABQ6C361_9BURK|nr:hypothetical protein [Hydrogenophaga electricum]GLS14671.1 hypothetical protein GCM10007935_21030 [Hydrogenophaga electricum]
MKARTLILVACLLLVAGFVALNLDEIFRPTTLNFAVTEVQAPMGLVLLGLLALVLVVFLLALVFNQTTHLMEVRRISREAAEQRQLADKAEASRIAELRDDLRSQVAHLESQQQTQANALQQQIERSHAELARLFEQTSNGLSASLGELEDRLERQERLAPPPGA